MLISAMVPQAVATQAANAVASQAALAAATSAAATRPLTATAVNAAVAARAYQPQVPEQRRAPSSPAVLTAPASTQGEASILPDPEFWRVPDRQVEVPQPQTARPAEVTVQQAAPYVAQATAQQAPEVKTQQRSEEPPANLPGSRKPAALIGKKPGVSDSSGFGAYAVASQRTISIDLPTTVEAFA